MSLSDKYLQQDGTIFLTGVQGLVRVAFDQHRADVRRGLRTATMVSGYQGSPLAGFDAELARNHRLADEHSVHLVPGLNEELGATAVWGSQLAANLPGPRYDGVLGMWYGKAPGLDRAGDAIRHGNWVGCGPTGGVLALVGDDPSSKSSTLPSASEGALADFGIPTLYPGTVQDVLDYGLHGFNLSRASGLWSALKMVTSVADSVGTAVVSPQRVAPVMPEVDPLSQHRPHGHLLAPQTLDLERSLYEVRLPRAVEYARRNDLNRTLVNPSDAWLGVIAGGKPFTDFAQALEILGLGAEDLERMGVRVMKLGMIFPLDAEGIAEFSRGLDRVLVVEEKRPFVESQVKEALYGRTGAPPILGKATEEGLPLLPGTGELDGTTIAHALVRVLATRLDTSDIERRLGRSDQLAARPMAPLPVSRTPFFCSGCPHSSSTAAPEGTQVGVGIGCHTMVLLNPGGKGDLTGVTQMGGEGAQWVGMAPFTSADHFVQNVGDGTFHHSGSLGVRFAVAAGANITFKLLYNRVVAMTGGQDVEGALEVPALTRMLEAEGVSRIIVTSDERRRYRRLAKVAEVWKRDDIEAAQRELAETPGVTVLIHDQECAAELRRLRKRGKAPEPEMRVAINQRVCEGCGDCGEKSGCLSVQPVETEFGRKTQIHQPSCNKDYSCLEGDCPAFVSVEGVSKLTPPHLKMPDIDLPEPERRVSGSDVRIRFAGVGGTGVVTVNQVMGMAGMLEGKHVRGLDQTGLSQKGGPVISDLRISEGLIYGTPKAEPGSVDVYLVFDLLTGVAPQNLAATDPERTIPVVSTSAVPTGQMVVDPKSRFPELNRLLDVLATSTRTDEAFFLDAEALAVDLFADSMPANLLALGAAFQHGVIPLSAESIEAAIRLNGAAVDKNLAAFAWGRACVVSPTLVESVTRSVHAEPTWRRPSEEEAEIVASTGAAGELRRLLEIRVPELVDFQSVRLARDYAAFVKRVLDAEREVGESTALAEAVARNLYKLLAYKDEYEVARLHMLEAEQRRIRSDLGPGARFSMHLRPPILAALGLKRKLKLHGWFTIPMTLLRRLKWMRGHWIDPFGHTRVRRTERRLPVEYRLAIERSLEVLAPDTHATAVELAELPDMVRGYEELKMTNVAAYEAELGKRMSALGLT